MPFTAFVLPLIWLNMRKNKKLNQFGKQLPEAIELITRCLKAGHPVPVALSMVGREMPDPIGTEFGMVVDEVTYGSDLVTALLSLYERVGHPDLALAGFVRINPVDNRAAICAKFSTASLRLFVTA